MNMSRIIANQLANELKEHQEALRNLQLARINLSLSGSTTDTKLVMDIMRHQEQEIKTKKQMLEAATKDADRIDEEERRVVS